MMIQSKENYLVLFSFCKVVKGVDKSIICDFQKEKIRFIPNEMGEVINMLQEQPFDSVKKYFEDDINIFNSYVNFLIDEGFAFYNDTKENFVSIENYWASPEIINNAIIESDFTKYDLNSVLKQLDGLLTKFIEFRFTEFEYCNISDIEKILAYCTSSVLRSLRLYIPFKDKEDSKKIIQAVKPFPIVECVVFYNSKSSRSIIKDNQQVFFITQTLEEITSANIDRKFFINNISYYYECQKYNPYYNKKVSIDVDGQIKNCIKNKAVFGNVKNDLILDVVTQNKFQEFWYVTHDQILDIKDSELRYNYIVTNDLEKIDNEKFKIII